MAFSAMNRLPMLSCGEPDTDVEAGMNLLAGVLPLRHASVWGALPRNGAFYQAAQIRGAGVTGRMADMVCNLSVAEVFERSGVSAHSRYQ